MPHSSTRVSVLRCEGNHAEELKLVIKHTSSLPPGSEPLDKNERAASILPPTNGVVPLSLQLRINRKLISAEHLQTSGLLKAIMAFLREYGSRLRIQSVDEPVVDGSRLQVSLQLEPFSSPMMQRFETTAVRFEHLDFALQLYSPPNQSPSSTPFRDQLLSKRLVPSVSSLIYRAMLKCWSALAVKYPLVFNLRWVQHIQDQLVYLPSLTRSLARLSQKSGSPDKSALLQRCLARLRHSASLHGDNYEADPTSSVTAEDTHMVGASPAQPSNSQILQSATFALLLHANKRKHALTKLQLEVINTFSGDNVNEASKDPSTTSSLPSTPSPLHNSQESQPIDELIPLLPEASSDWMLADSSPSSIIVDDNFQNPYDILRAFDFTSQGENADVIHHFDDSFAEYDSSGKTDVLDAFLPALENQYQSLNMLECFNTPETPFPVNIMPPASPLQKAWDEDMHVQVWDAILPDSSPVYLSGRHFTPISQHFSSTTPAVDCDMLMDALSLIQAADDLMGVEDTALDEVDAMMQDLFEEQHLDKLDEIMSTLADSTVTCSTLSMA